MQGIKGASRHWPAVVIEFERAMFKEPKTAACSSRIASR